MDLRYSYLRRNDREGSDRVNAFRRLLTAGNIDLTGPFTFTVYGDTFNIDGDVY
jgi:chitosanase